MATLSFFFLLVVVGFVSAEPPVGGYHYDKPKSSASFDVIKVNEKESQQSFVEHQPQQFHHDAGFQQQFHAPAPQFHSAPAVHHQPAQVHHQQTYSAPVQQTYSAPAVQHHSQPTFTKHVEQYHHQTEQVFAAPQQSHATRKTSNANVGNSVAYEIIPATLVHYRSYEVPSSGGAQTSYQSHHSSAPAVQSHHEVQTYQAPQVQHHAPQVHHHAPQVQTYEAPQVQHHHHVQEVQSYQAPQVQHHAPQVQHHAPQVQTYEAPQVHHHVQEVQHHTVQSYQAPQVQHHAPQVHTYEAPKVQHHVQQVQHHTVQSYQAPQVQHVQQVHHVQQEVHHAPKEYTQEVHSYQAPAPVQQTFHAPAPVQATTFNEAPQISQSISLPKTDFSNSYNAPSSYDIPVGSVHGTSKVSAQPEKTYTVTVRVADSKESSGQFDSFLQNMVNSILTQESSSGSSSGHTDGGHVTKTSTKQLQFPARTYGVPEQNSFTLTSKETAKSSISAPKPVYGPPL